MVKSHIWLPLELLFERINGSKNLQRAVPSTHKLQTKKMGTRVDMLVRVNNLKFLCEEDKASDDSTKTIEERHLKLVSLGITTFKFKAYFDVCDFKLGYVARITRSLEFQVPPCISELSKLLPMLSMMLIFRMMIMSNIDVITEAALESDVRCSLKRPHSPSEEDDFVRVVKRNLSATTPNSTFQSIFKQGQDKK